MAQQRPFKWAQINLNAGYGLPQAQFTDSYDKPKLHGGADIMIGVPEINMLFGLKYRRTNIGDDSHRIDSLTYVGDGLYAPAVTSGAWLKFNSFHLAARYVPWINARFSPYLDAGAGFKTLDYETYLTAHFTNGDESVRKNQNSSTAFSYGFGFGVFFKLHEHILLDARAEWQGSSAARYPLMNELYFDSNGIPNVSMNKSKSDMLYFCFGIVIFDLFDD